MTVIGRWSDGQDDQGTTYQLGAKWCSPETHLCPKVLLASRDEEVVMGMRYVAGDECSGDDDDRTGLLFSFRSREMLMMMMGGAMLKDSRLGRPH